MSKRRPITRSDAKKMMADALKPSAKSTTENKSARTFKVSNFKLRESGVIDVSAEETKKDTGRRGQERQIQEEQRRLSKQNPQRRLL